MKRISNRNHSEQVHMAPQVHYIDRHIEVSVPSEPRTIENRVEVLVPSEPRVIERIVEIQAPAVDLKPLLDKQAHFEAVINQLAQTEITIRNSIINELEMQRRALVGLKQQRDIDRSRRLQLIMRLKKHRDEQKKLNLKYKLAISTSILLTILSLIIKL